MQSILAVGIFVILLVALLIYFFKKPAGSSALIPQDVVPALKNNVAFYRNLPNNLKNEFQKKVEGFLNYVSIEGVKIEVTNVDRLLVAASAVIPVFYFDNWKYNNLSTVLLYPHPFNREEFLSEEFDKDTSGMVGNGPMQRMMILSLPQLREGFSIHAGASNVGIHEFVHLIDKEDGDVDGLPEALLDKKNNPEYLKLVEETTNEIINNTSDIDAYAITNRAEFFAVTSAYFLNAPDLFKKSHESLYKLYRKIYRWPA
jgi:hypothetical protein